MNLNLLQDSDLLQLTMCENVLTHLLGFYHEKTMHNLSGNKMGTSKRGL